jgi:ribosomal protein S24E
VRIIKREEKPLLSRAEVVAELVYEAVTPSRAETKRALARELKVSEEAIVIKRISPVFGENKSSVTCEVYIGAEEAKKIASKVYLMRDSADGKKEKTEEKSES